MLASININCQQSRISFIAPAFAATGFDAIILRSSLTRLRMTPGRPLSVRVMQMRHKLPHIYRCYEKIVESWKGVFEVERWKGEMVERFPHNKSYLTSKQSTSDYIPCHPGLDPGSSLLETSTRP